MSKYVRVLKVPDIMDFWCFIANMSTIKIESNVYCINDNGSFRYPCTLPLIVDFMRYQVNNKVVTIVTSFFTCISAVLTT